MQQRYYMLTLGCAKNVADSEGISAILTQADMLRADRAEDADVLIVNTCGFLQASRKESLAALRELASAKKDDQILIAAGCLISRYGDSVQRSVPQVDGLVDAGHWIALPHLIHHLQTSHSLPKDWLTDAYAGLPLEQLSARSIVERLDRSPGGPSAFLKIADGCDRPCAFCIIPAIKGAHRSKPLDEVITEARDLVAHGVKEITLVAQDTTAYGWDLGNREGLSDLIEQVCTRVEGLNWLRLMYTFPGHVTPRLIETMVKHQQVLHYIDVPLQHAHPETLKRMKRPNIGVTRDMLKSLRAAMPDLAIRTTFIVGFPGETDDEFHALLKFMDEQRFDRVGVFEYSREEGTSAATMDDPVPPKIMARRREIAMALQQKISFAKHQPWVGKTLDVLVEGVGDGISIARSYRDAPEVDGVILIQNELPIGQFVPVRITQALEYDLMGEVI
jgi:ribosomal protein S12 methylthiotransferase